MKRILKSIAVLGLVGAGLLIPGLTSTDALRAEESDTPWVVAAPGRLEPKGGMINIGTAIIGRISEVYIALNDEVEQNELLLKLDDAEARARLAAAETQADVREKTRDDGNLNKDRKDVRDAEDEVYRAERAATGARIELDYALSGRRNGTVTERTLRDARRRLEQADDRVQKARVKVARAQADPNLPAPSPAEAAVSEARAQVAIAEALLDKTRVRAPRTGRVLILRAKSGEMVAPNPQAPSSSSAT